MSLLIIVHSILPLRKALFEIVYGFVPRAPIDLLPLPTLEQVNFDAKQRAELILKLHETTKEKIECMNANIN